MSTPEPRPSRSDARGGAAILLGTVGLVLVGTGVGLLFGAAWVLVVLGAILTVYAVVLALPSRSLW